MIHHEQLILDKIEYYSNELIKSKDVLSQRTDNNYISDHWKLTVANAERKIIELQDSLVPSSSLFHKDVDYESSTFAMVSFIGVQSGSQELTPDHIYIEIKRKESIPTKRQLECHVREFSGMGLWSASVMGIIHFDTFFDLLRFNSNVNPFEK